jgi:hypothetical protein
MRFNLFIKTLQRQNHQTLILKRRLQRPELSTFRLYLSQLNTILDNNYPLTQIKTDYQSIEINNNDPRAIMDYLDKLFIIYKKSVNINGVDLDLTLETWRLFFSTIHRKDVNLLLDNINNHEKYNIIHKYLDKNSENLDKMFNEKELIRLFNMLYHFDNLKYSKTSKKLHDYHLEGDLDRYDLHDLLKLQNAYSVNNLLIDNFKSQTADTARYKIFNNINPSKINEQDLMFFSTETNDFNHLMSIYDQNNNFLWLKTKIFLKYISHFTVEINTDAEKFLIDSLDNLDLNSNKPNVYLVNVVSNLYAIRRVLRRRVDFPGKFYSNILSEYLTKNKKYFFDNFHLVYDKYIIVQILYDLKKDQLNLEDINYLLENLNKQFLPQINDKNKVENLKIQNFLSILCIYDYLIYLKSIKISRDYLQSPIIDDNLYTSRLKMGEFTSYNHSNNESNIDLTINKSYFTYSNLIRNFREENSNLCYTISNMYNYLIPTTYLYSFYPLSKSITFLFNIHNRQDLALKLVQKLLTESLEQVTNNHRLCTLLLSTLTLFRNYRFNYNKWPLISYLKAFLSKNSFQLDRHLKTTIIHFILNSPSTISDSFDDLKTSLFDIIETSSLDNCYTITRGLSANIQVLIENHPDSINQLANKIFTRVSMQLMLPLVDLEDDQIHEINKKLNYGVDESSNKMNLMLDGHLRMEKVKFYRTQRAYIYLIFMIRKFRMYKSFLDINFMFSYAEEIDFTHLIKFIYEYMGEFEAGRVCLLPNMSSSSSGINYNIDKVVQKLCWLTQIYHNVGFYNQNQLDILWSYLIVCLDFLIKNDSNNHSYVVKHSMICSILKLFSKFDYSSSNLYLTQKYLMFNLIELYFDKYKHELLFTDLIFITRALNGLGFYSENVFKYLYNHKILTDYTISQDENEIVVHGGELINVSFKKVLFNLILIDLKTENVFFSFYL